MSTYRAVQYALPVNPGQILRTPGTKCAAILALLSWLSRSFTGEKRKRARGMVGDEAACQDDRRSVGFCLSGEISRWYAGARASR